jgi:hypothetical protein
MRTCSQKNTGEDLGPTEVSLHTRAVCLRHLRLGSFLTGSGCRVMSGLPPIATVPRTSLEVRFVPSTEVAKARAYSITSLARARIIGGIVIRNDLARV